MTAAAFSPTAAWRTRLTCRMERECPGAHCERVFEPSEWKAVRSAASRAPPPTLSAIVYLVARLGGYVERPASGPRPETICIGLQRMRDLARASDAFGQEPHTPGGRDF